ncbi:MAG TPA: hypothetical protein DEG43_17525 [Acidimicrobiaceae bacterium]|jgi:hypothetical protein|nr:hypothetical protein [Acidimicrobiaceae bacterium]
MKEPLEHELAQARVSEAVRARRSLAWNAAAAAESETWRGALCGAREAKSRVALELLGHPPVHGTVEAVGHDVVLAVAGSGHTRIAIPLSEILAIRPASSHATLSAQFEEIDEITMAEILAELLGQRQRVTASRGEFSMTGELLGVTTTLLTLRREHSSEVVYCRLSQTVVSFETSAPSA